MSSPTPATEISYAEFGAWYDTYRAEVLEPALTAASAALDRALVNGLTDRDLTRIRTTSGRVKSKRRTWRKVQQPRYDGQVLSVQDIPKALDDLVGLRVTCINVRDIEMVQTALESLPRSPGDALWLDPNSERDYIAAPKESGYRGWHINLGTTVADTAVLCELQVRTLLQDSWGELTHEDTYSKDGALPPLVEVLSTRMSDLLSILDDIAEDLRTELDRIDEAVVSEPDLGDAALDDVLVGQAADAATLLVARWTDMDRPTDLAALAWALQKEFGAEVSDDWFGHDSFKRFLRHAVPDGEISTGRQAYLLPRASGTTDVPDAGDTTDAPIGDGDDPSDASEGSVAPGAARQLRRIDPQFPLLSGADWATIFDHLAESWRRVKPSDAALGTVNRLARSARDLAKSAGRTLSRRNVDYVVRTLLASGDRTVVGARPTPDSATLRAAFADQTVQRMVDLRIIDTPDSKAGLRVERWLEGPEDN